MQVRQNGVIVFVPKYGIEGPVYLTAKGSDAEAAFTMDEVQRPMAHTLLSPATPSLDSRTSPASYPTHSGPACNSLLMRNATHLSR